MEYKKFRGIKAALFLTAFLTLPVWGRDVRADSTVVKEVTGSAQLVKELSKTWEDDYAAETVINTASGTVSQNGEKVSFEEAFETDGQEDVPNLHSSYEVKSYFEDHPAEVSEVKGSNITVVNPYQTKQIIVNTDTLVDYCGAESVLHYDELGAYYLRYATEEETKDAYEVLKRRFGKNCMLDQIMQAEQAQQSSSWGTGYMGFERLKYSPSVSGISDTVTVAVVDTGLNRYHHMFTGRRISSASRNIVDNNSNISDVTGHGTHVAGIVADCTPAQVELMAVRVYDDDGLSSFAMLQAGLLYAVQKGADVINISLGQTDYTSAYGDWLGQSIQAAWQQGIPLVCAAGNSRKNVSTCYPACSDKTIAVSAIDQNGSFAQTFTGTDGSNYGSGIDFAAPGVNINSASARNNSELDSRSGTSMAAPFVSAAAAYVKLALPDSTVTQVKNILKSYAQDYGAAGKDAYYGYGVIKLADLMIGLSGNAKLTVQNPSMVYSGTACCPGVLVSGIASGQYTVSYRNNTRPGTGTVTVTGKGLYTGSVSQNFKITLGTPKMKSAENGAKGISVKWNSLPGADTYTIYRKKGSGSWSKLKTVSSGVTSYTDTKVSAGSTYQYRLQAAGGAQTSGYSAAVKSVFVKSASLTSISNSDTEVTLKWKKVSGISGYRIYRKTSGQNTWVYVKQVSSKSTSCTDTKAVHGQLCTYQVRPYKTVSGKKYLGGGANSKSIVYMKKMAAPTLQNAKTKKLNVYWKAAAGADSYQVRWSLKKTMSSSKTLKIKSKSQLSAVISGLKKNKTYYVQIRSVKKIGSSTGYSAWSSKKSVKIKK